MGNCTNLHNICGKMCTIIDTQQIATDLPLAITHHLCHQSYDLCHQSYVLCTIGPFVGRR